MYLTRRITLGNSACIINSNWKKQIKMSNSHDRWHQSWIGTVSRRAMGWGGPPSGAQRPRDVLQSAVGPRERWPASPPARVHLAFCGSWKPLGTPPALWFLQEHTLYLFTLTVPLPDSQGDNFPGIPDAMGALLVNVNMHRSLGARSCPCRHPHSPR